MSFWDNEVEWKELGEVCINIFSWKNKERSENWKYPIFWSTWIIWKTNQYIYNTKQILVARVWVNAWLIHIGKWEYDVSDNTLIIQNKDEIKLKFLYYLLINMNINQYAKWWWQPLITAWLLKSLKIPMPDLQKQQEIIAILDKFDALVNDISVWLPAELKARRQQYEYYRNKLLDFKVLEK